jgi:hypothetical protein
MSEELSAIEGRHGTGHKDDTVSQATGALVLMCLIILVLVTLYMSWRVYLKKKYLTEYWIKEFGQSNRMSMLDISPSKIDQSQVEEEDNGLELATNKKPVGPDEIGVEIDDEASGQEIEMGSDEESEEQEEAVESDEEEEEESNQPAANNSKLHQKQQQIEKLDKERKQDANPALNKSAKSK